MGFTYQGVPLGQEAEVDESLEHRLGEIIAVGKARLDRADAIRDAAQGGGSAGERAAKGLRRLEGPGNRAPGAMAGLAPPVAKGRKR
jgi:hypothetical protein